MSQTPVHSLLRRQLKRCFGADFAPPPEWRELLDAVDAAYREFDSDRAMLERSLELSSQELLQASAEMRAVFQAIPDLLIRIDPQGRVLDCRVGMAGGSASGLEDGGATPEELARPHLVPEFRAAVEKAFASSKMTAMEYSLPVRGEARHYEARLVPVLHLQVVAFVRDITARRRSEEQLFSSQAMLRTILDTIPQRVFWKDRNSVYLGANRPHALDTGFKDGSELVGRKDFATSSADMAERYRADEKAVMESNTARFNYEEPLRRPDGSIGWLQTSKVPLHDQEGRVIGVLGTYEDITERKQIESLRA